MYMPDENLPSPAEPNPAEEARVITELKKQNEELAKKNADLEEAKRKYYEKVLNDNNPEEPESKRSSEEIRKELVEKQSKGCSNLAYAQLVIELNDAVIEETGQSCFLPKGKDVNINANDEMIAEKFPRVIKECIEESDGDEAKFNAALKNHMK